MTSLELKIMEKKIRELPDNGIMYLKGIGMVKRFPYDELILCRLCPIYSISSDITQRYTICVEAKCRINYCKEKL